MTGKQISAASAMTAAAVLLQTTLFAQLRPAGVGPDLVLLAVIACSYHLRGEAAVLLGFIGGLLIDLSGTAPLGLQAMAATLVAFATVRAAPRMNYGVGYQLAGAALLSLLGVFIVALVGTLFGEGTLGSPEIIPTLLLVPVYNVILGLGMIPLANRWVRARAPRRGLLL